MAARRRKKTVPEYLTEEEVARLFVAIGKDVRSQAIFHVMYYRGLRASEIGKLRLEDYRAAVGRLFVRRLKGSNSGEFHLTESERTALNRWVRKRGKDPGPLFISRNGKPLSRWPVFALMKRYCAAAGIAPEKAHPHALKHSCGTHLSARANDVAVIQDHLGHVNIQNTMIYVQITNKRRDQFAESLTKDGWGSR
ncbi:MAG TPA: tyrosine-type recombinase/integrase [Bryobacteraceae bacterium]|jgi:site-specific recombinase XerD|nr:tyrosine-type recombinase/integrase [Bryobacteraceae bacterium]